jgi:hypothetical protein
LGLSTAGAALIALGLAAIFGGVLSLLKGIKDVQISPTEAQEIMKQLEARISKPEEQIAYREFLSKMLHGSIDLPDGKGCISVRLEDGTGPLIQRRIDELK